MAMKTFAIALYENEAESEDELNFKKNDLLQIMNIDYMGMEGWWLCKLIKNSKIGLAAGNRLKLISDEKFILKINTLINEQSDSISMCKSERANSKTNSILSTSFSCASSKSSCTSLNSTQTSISLPIQSQSTNTLPDKINVRYNKKPYLSFILFCFEC